ncbi:hypothetical protein WDH52_00355 [Streptomyces sp. TRM70308]|uniref:hypothetical protein n=1 Tax=Streptomyces sp. TRM70308 TaxID=3131932 RepID=UPI003D04B486
MRCGRPPRAAAALTLLLVAPAVTAVACALAPRREADRRATPAPPDAPEPTGPPPVPAGLSNGAALVGLGLALETYAAGAAGAPVPLPGAGAGPDAGVFAGWLLTALGLVLAGPGLTRLAGRALAAFRPGAVRLLAGRVLQEEAAHVGPPLGVLCATVCGLIAALTLYGPDRPFGPLTVLGGGIVLACAVTGVLTAVAGARSALAPTRQALAQLGAARGAARRAAALRAGATVAVLAPVTWGVAVLAALPLAR